MIETTTLSRTEFNALEDFWKTGPRVAERARIAAEMDAAEAAEGR